MMKRLLAVWLFSAVASMAAFLSSGTATGASGTITTTSFNTTGADLIVCACSASSLCASPADFYSNSWSSIVGTNQTMYYSNVTTVGTVETVSVTANNSSLICMAFSATGLLDKSGTANMTGFAANTATITPSANSELIIGSATVPGTAPTCGASTGFNVTLTQKLLQPNGTFVGNELCAGYQSTAASGFIGFGNSPSAFGSYRTVIASFKGAVVLTYVSNPWVIMLN